MQYSVFIHVTLALALYLLAKFSVLPHIINLLILRHWLEMDEEASNLLAVMRTRSLPESQTLELYSKLKADVKHIAVPEKAISPLFELIHLALESPNYLDAGLSMLSHLIKRLQGQHQDSILNTYAQRTVPLLIELLGSPNVRHRSRARQGLAELHGVSSTTAHTIVTLLGDVTFTSDDVRAQEEALRWILTMNKDRGLKVNISASMVLACVKSSDKYLSKAAKACFIQLFRISSTTVQRYTHRELQQAGLDHTTLSDILFEIGPLPNQSAQRSTPMHPSPQQPSSQWAPSSFNNFRFPSRSVSRSTETSTATVPHKPSDGLSSNTSHLAVEPSHSAVARPTSRSISQSTELSNSTICHKPSESTNTSVTQPTIEPLPFVPVTSKAEQEAEKLDPIYLGSARDVDNMFREMLPYFEGAETDQNWKHRGQSALKIRKVTKGNAYDDYPTAYLTGVKLLLNGLIGVAESLRTTQCTLGCHCIEDIARRIGPNLDPLVEILLQSLVKLCGQTKKISAADGDSSVTSIISNVSFNVRIAQHIHRATQDKNVSPRLFACGWLMTLLTKHGHHKSVFEHNGALDLIYKSIAAGLMDKDASVRTRMRPTYWAFARLWHDKSEGILLSLENKQQQSLLKDATNPFPDTSAVAAVLGENAAAISQSTSTIPGRPSIKETMARNRANRNLPVARPSSAGPTLSPTRETSSQVIEKPATNGLATRKPLSTSTSGTLSSAPVRPNRMFRRPELPRPATADPSSRRPKHDARSATPAARRPKTPVAPTPAKKGILATKKPISQPASPSKTIHQRRISWSDDLPGGTLESGPSKQINNDQATTEGNDVKSGTMVQVVNRPAQAAEVALPDSINSDMAPKTGEDDNEDVWMSISREGTPQPRKANESASRSPAGRTDHKLDMSRYPGMSRKLSQSPPDVRGQNEVHSPRKRPHLRVYEDQEAMPTDFSPIQSPKKPSVLSDLPINAPPPNPSHLLVGEETNGSEYHAKWTAFEASEQKLTSNPSLLSAYRTPRTARRLLETAIKQIRAGDIDLAVLRSVQSIIREQDKLWEDEYLLDDLLLTLLDAIEQPGDSSRQPQILITIRQLLAKYPSQCSPLYPRALCAITVARAGRSSSQRIVSGLEATAETIVAQCEPTESLNAVLDLLDAEGLDIHSMFMAFYTLTGLLAKMAHPLDASTERRIGELVGRSLNHSDTDIRRGIVELSVQFYQCVKPEERFWAYVAGSGMDCRSLITYYLMRKDAVKG